MQIFPLMTVGMFSRPWGIGLGILEPLILYLNNAYC